MKNIKIEEIVKYGILEFLEETLDYYGTPNSGVEYLSTFMYNDDNTLSTQGNQVVAYWEDILNRHYSNEQINNLHKNLDTDIFYEVLPDMVAKIIDERKEMKQDDLEISEVKNIGYEVLCDLGVEHYGKQQFKSKVKEAKQNTIPAMFDKVSTPELTR